MDTSTQPGEPTGTPSPMPPSEPPVASDPQAPSISDAMAQFLEPAAAPVSATPIATTAPAATPQLPSDPDQPDLVPKMEIPDELINEEPTAPISAPVEPAVTAPETSTDTPTSLVSDLPPIPAAAEVAIPEQPAVEAVTAPTVITPEPITSVQPVAESTVTPEPSPVTPMSYEPTAIEDTSMPTSSEAGMPNANQMELDQPTETESTGISKPKKVLKTVVGVFVVFVAGLLIKSNSATLGTHNLKSKGYTYSFKFYRNSSQFSYGDGATGFKHADDIIGSARPTTSQDITNCTEVGNGWRETFNVTINGARVPVCTPDSMTYITVFNGAGHEQQLTISYKTVQKADAIPVLKAMFESVSVKK